MMDNKVIIQDILNEYKKVLLVPNTNITETSTTSISAGVYNGPIELGLKKWKKSELGPYTEFSKHPVNKEKKQKTLKNNISTVVGVWEKDKDGSYEIDIHDVHTVNEDLAVWFGTKKKPKGSKQPAGPWVNICRKKEGGGHPPCGRPDADPKGYPKCRAKGVASKMTDSQKKSACSKKRNAEKKDTQTGKGQKPVYSSYKPRKESVEFLPPIKLVNLAGRVLYEVKKQGINENLTVIKNLYNRVPFTEKMIQELNELLKNRILVESKEDKLNYLLLGGDETKRWINTILYSIKKGS
jgi:hypothetical protein